MAENILCVDTNIAVKIWIRNSKIYLSKVLSVYIALLILRSLYKLYFIIYILNKFQWRFGYLTKCSILSNI